MNGRSVIRWLRWVYAAVLPVALLSLGGCGKGTCSVSGTVLFDGEPLPEGSITFFGSGGRQAAGVIEDGRFVVRNAPVGEVKVTVVTVPPPGHSEGGLGPGGAPGSAGPNKSGTGKPGGPMMPTKPGFGPQMPGQQGTIPTTPGNPQLRPGQPGTTLPGKTGQPAKKDNKDKKDKDKVELEPAEPGKVQIPKDMYLPETGLPSASDPSAKDAKYVKIPDRYKNPESSGLTYTLKAGKRVINIQLDP